MGTHVSKVRSLGLDALDETDLTVLREVGNARSNAIWEHSLHEQGGWTKPTPNSPAEEKRRFVKAKYVWKGFVEGSSNSSRDGGEVAGSSMGGYPSGGGVHRRGSGSSSSALSGRDGSGGGGLDLLGGGNRAGAERWSRRLSDCAATGDLAGAVEALAHCEVSFGGNGWVGVLFSVI